MPGVSNCCHLCGKGIETVTLGRRVVVSVMSRSSGRPICEGRPKQHTGNEPGGFDAVLGEKLE